LAFPQSFASAGRVLARQKQRSQPAGSVWPISPRRGPQTPGVARLTLDVGDGNCGPGCGVEFFAGDSQAIRWRLHE